MQRPKIAPEDFNLMRHYLMCDIRSYISMAQTKLLAYINKAFYKLRKKISKIQYLVLFCFVLKKKEPLLV